MNEPPPSGPDAPKTISADQIVDPRLRALHAYWSERAGSTPAPSRAAIDPMDMPRDTLPYVLLTERVDADGRARFRYRIVGSAIAETAGRDPTWEYLDEALTAESGYRDYVLRLYDIVMRWVKPLYSECAYYTGTQPGEPVRRTRRLMLPLADADGRVTHVLSGQVFENTQGVIQKPFLTADAFEPGACALVEPA